MVDSGIYTQKGKQSENQLIFYLMEVAVPRIMLWKNGKKCKETNQPQGKKLNYSCVNLKKNPNK